MINICNFWRCVFSCGTCKIFLCVYRFPYAVSIPSPTGQSPPFTFTLSPYFPLFSFIPHYLCCSETSFQPFFTVSPEVVDDETCDRLLIPTDQSGFPRRKVRPSCRPRVRVSTRVVHGDSLFTKNIFTSHGYQSLRPWSEMGESDTVDRGEWTV